MNTLCNLLLEAPDEQMDPILKQFISKWDDEPTSLQILEVIDHAVYSALASDFVVSVLQSLYENALKSEGKTDDDNARFATWRKGF
jgi:hypothetical protein